MPIATTSGAVTERKELKTLEDGFVEIRRMTYGELLHRREMTSNMVMESAGADDVRSVIQMMKEEVVIWEFANLITDHNLEDEDGAGGTRKLNFANVADVRKLDAKVGDEISSYIDELNQFTEDDQGNSGSGSAAASS